MPPGPGFSLVPLVAATHGVGAVAEKLGVIVAALLASAFVLGAGRIADRRRAVAALAAVALTPVLLLADIWDTTQLRHLRAHPGEAAAALVVGLVLIAALTVLIRRRPTALPLLAVGAVPFRLPISTGGATSNLLIPLYLIVGAGMIAYVIPRLARGGARGRAPATADAEPRVWMAARNGDSDCEPRVEPVPARLEWLLMGFVVLYALQAAYSGDFSKALENVVFFYIPFALLFGLLRQVRWTRELLLACVAIVVVEAVLFTTVGFVEYGRKHLLLNPKVVQANQYDNFFRVNSLFFDPSIYGRFLALVMVIVTTVVLWTRRRRVVLGSAVVLAWLLGGLITSFSQSSIAALLAGLLVLAAWRWNPRDTALVAVLLAAVGLLVLLFAPSGSHLGLSGSKSADSATSGRASLVSNGISLFGDRPLGGYGPGSFSKEYLSHNARAVRGDATSASHAIPITVAAEQGVLGLAAYVALLVAAFGRLFRGARTPERIGLAACFSALVLHTFAYADFLEDPVTWTLLGIATALALPAAGPGLRRWWRRVVPPEQEAAAAPAAGEVAPSGAPPV
jgi:O-antigen ligase